MKRNIKQTARFSYDVTDDVSQPHISLGSRIRTALETGVSENILTPKTYDDKDSDYDPSSDIRSDRWDSAEQAIYHAMDFTDSNSTVSNDPNSVSPANTPTVDVQTSVTE